MFVYVLYRGRWRELGILGLSILACYEDDIKQLLSSKMEYLVIKNVLYECDDLLTGKFLSFCSRNEDEKAPICRAVLRRKSLT